MEEVEISEFSGTTFILPHDVMVSITDFDSVSIGSSPFAVTENWKMAPKVGNWT